MTNNLEYSNIKKERCHAINESGTRCKLNTQRGIYCWIHEKAKRHFRITQTNNSHDGLGLITTEPIPIGHVIAEYSGKKTHSADLQNPFVLPIGPKTFLDASNSNIKSEGKWIQNGGHKNAEFVKQGSEVFAYATKSIPAKSEILAPHKIVKGKIKNGLIKKKPSSFNREDAVHQYKELYNQLHDEEVSGYRAPYQAPNFSWTNTYVKRKLKAAKLAANEAAKPVKISPQTKVIVQQAIENVRNSPRPHIPKKPAIEKPILVSDYKRAIKSLEGKSPEIKKELFRVFGGESGFVRNWLKYH